MHTFPVLTKPLPLGEVSPQVTERARMLTVIRGRSDSIALTKSLLIAAWADLSCRACPLSRFAPALPKGEPLAGRATSYWTPEARYDAKGRALLQRAAASGQYPLSSCRESRQRSTPVSEKIRLCSSRVGLTDSPEAPLLGELANEVRLRGCTKTEPDREPLLDSTSPSRLTPCHLPYRGEALAVPAK